MPYKDYERRRTYAREWIQERRNQWFKENGPCQECGSWINLELDHIDPKTKVSHRVWSWSEERRNKELAKCQALCRQCHKRKTIDSLPKTDHGRAAMYQNYKCRCELCRHWKQISDAKYRNKGR